MATARKWEHLYHDQENEIKAQVEQDLDKIRDEIQKDPELAKKAAQIIEEMLKKERPSVEKK